MASRDLLEEDPATPVFSGFLDPLDLGSSAPQKQRLVEDLAKLCRKLKENSKWRWRCRYSGRAGRTWGPGLGGHGGFRGGFSSGLMGHSCGGKAEDKEWVPVTKLGHQVKDMKSKSLEQIYLVSLPIKESEIMDFFLGASLKDEVLKILPVQKAGQRTRFKAFVAIGDYSDRVGLGDKCSKELATAIRGAKLSIVPVWRGYRGNKIGKPHTVPCKVTGRCVSVLVVCLIPYPRGTGVVSAPVPKKLLTMVNMMTATHQPGAALPPWATFDAISKTYRYLTPPAPHLWKKTVCAKSPYQDFTDRLVKTHTRVSVQRTQAPAVTTT